MRIPRQLWAVAIAAVVVCTTAAPAAAGIPSGSASAAPVTSAPSTSVPTFKLIAHAPVKAGAGASVDVVASGLPPISGYELTATINKVEKVNKVEKLENSGFDLAGADSSTGAAIKAGFSDISMSDLDTRAVLAAYAPHGQTVWGTVTLGTFYLAKVPAGRVQLRVGAVRLAGPSGAVVPVSAAALTTVIASGNASTSYPAPAASWQLPQSANKFTSKTGPTSKLPANPELQMTWQNVRLAGNPCSAAGRQVDRNGDGCLDVGDLVSNALTQPASAASAMASSVTPARATTTFTVTSTADLSDSSVGDGVCRSTGSVCTLRGAIQEANAHAGADVINFAIPGSGVHTIQLTSHLPALSDNAGGTLIDGYTQPGSVRNTSTTVDNAKLMIQVRGNGAGGDGTTTGFDALPITSASNTVRGLSMFNSRRELWINGASAAHNSVVGDFIGTDAIGTFVTPAIELDAIGIKIELDAPFNDVGTSNPEAAPVPADRNVVSGNGRQGIALWHNGTDHSVIVNNIVGLSPDGTRSVPNRKHGIDLNFGASQVQIGGLGVGDRNLVSGNDDDGIELSHTVQTTANDVAGNYVGTDATGNAAFPYTANGGTGIYLEDGVTANTIESNVIVNNKVGGMVSINGSTNGNTTANIIRNNLIGIGTGGATLPNLGFGIMADGSGNTWGPGNSIRFNKGPGIEIDDTVAVHNKITQNVIADNTGASIDLSPVAKVNPNDPGDGDTGANDGLNFPEPMTTTPSAVSGTACAGCSVEIFTTGVATGHGPLRSFVGAATANASGAFSLPISLPLGTALTGVAIAPNGDTSEVAQNVTVVAAGNHAPTISAGPAITVDPASNTSLQATVSDPDGTAASVLWDLDGNGTFETVGNPVVFNAPATGPATITVKARATDPGGLTSTSSKVITVRGQVQGPGAPDARMVVPNEVVAGSTIPVSMDQPDRSGLVYAFNCGSGFGASSSATSIVCPPASGASDTIQSKVTDPAKALSTTYSTVVVVHPNLATNGDFEAGSTSPTGWAWGVGRQYVTSPVHSGTHAISSPATGASTAVASQPYNVVPDRSRYALSAYVNAPSAGSGSVTVRLRWYNSSGTNLATVAAGTVSSASGGWVQLTNSFTPPTGSVRALIEIAWNTSGRAIAVDDVVLRRDNGVQNAEFDLDANSDGKPDIWSQQGRFTRSAAASHLSGFSGKATGDGGAFTVAQRVATVKVGARYTINGWINVPANTDVFSLQIQLRWQDATAHNTLSLVKIAGHAGTSSTPYVTAGWQPFSASVVAPTGAAFANLEFAYSAGFTSVSYLDSVVMSQS